MNKGGSRWLSSMIFLGLGVFAGTKLGSGTQPIQQASIPSSVTEVLRDVEGSRARAPASVPSGPVVSLEPLNSPVIERSPLAGMDKVENYLKLQEFTKKMKEQFEANYLRNHFVIPRGDEDYHLVREAVDRKVALLQRVSRFWRADLTLNVRDVDVRTVIRMDVGAIEYGDKGMPIVSCGRSRMTMTVEGQNFEIPMYVQCGPVATHKDRLFTFTDTEYLEDVRDVLKYVMIPLPDEGGSGFFLESSTLKWHSTEEIRWQKASEVDFRD